MPLDLGDDEARAYLRTADAPGPMLDLVGMMAAHAAAAALQLGVFDALASAPATAGELARRLPADPAALPVLLDTLAATGYLAADGGRYAVTPLTRQWLCADAPSGYGRVFRLWFTFVTQLWADLAPAVRTGRPGADFYAWLGERPELATQFQQLQAGLAGWLAEEVVDVVPVPAGARRLLDLGGGHGAFSTAFCARYPALAATVVDLPGVGPAEPGERIRWRAGDLTAGVPDRDQDIVLLCNVVHGFPPEQARALVRDAVAALRPGGRLVLLESAAAGGGAGPADTAFARCFSLHLWLTQGGQVYPVDTLAGWLRAAGCEPPDRHVLARSSGHVLLTAARTG